jgi:uncharacterized protein YbjT (DUF2867 family)
MTTRALFIAGATGAVGQRLVPLAIRQQADFLAHARPKSASKLGSAPSTVLELSDPKLIDVLKGRNTVISLIGTMRKRFDAGDTYESSDIGTTRELLSAASAAGTIDHFVLLSSVGAGSPRGAYLKAKAEAERLVVVSGIPYTIFRPSAFEDREGAFLPGARAITKLLGLRKYEPIKLQELASAILYSAMQRGPLNSILEGDALWELVTKAPRD